MFIRVKLLNGYQKPLWYQAQTIQKNLSIGTVVHVPLRTRIVPALVIAQYQEKPKEITFNLKEIQSIEPFPYDAMYWSFIEKLASHYHTESIHFVQRIKKFLTTKKIHSRVKKSDTTLEKEAHIQKVSLTNEQEHAYNALAPHIQKAQYIPAVLHGVTGSGKTEIYKKLILDTIAQNKTALLLLPEVTLAVAFEQRIKKELGDNVIIYGFHSATPEAEKRTIWNNLLVAKPMLIIGVHLPVLLPIANLGLMIIDEEHETGYQEKKYPKINTKEVAIWRAHMYGIPIILGSATPSLNTLHNVKTKQWHFLQLKNRFAGAFPQIRIAYLSDKKQRKNFWISTQLYHAIKETLQQKKQIILFLNRRGHSFFVQCKACSFIFSCTNCSVSLTLHADDKLRCHYCEYKRTLPHACPVCSVSEQEFIKKGVGTQRLVTIIKALFPYARVARADLDTTTKRKKWQETMNAFQNGTIDILVGTQTITKGYDFPNVTLVGIIWADLNLNFPLFNASETTLQQLIQVAGRAGRFYKESSVIVQAMEHHTIFDYLNEIDYLQFYTKEMVIRKELGYPPYKRLALIEIKHTHEPIIEKDAYALMYQLQTTRTRKKLDVQILGPSQPPVHRIKRTFIRHIYIKAKRMQDIHTLVRGINHDCYKSMLLFTPSAM